MKALAIGSFFVLFAIVAGVAATPVAYANHPTAQVSVAPGSSIVGCEETNECYIPEDVTVDVGGEVTWSNDDTAAHTVTSGTPADGPDGMFDSSLFLAGAEYTVTFEEEGVVDYFCIVHPWMVGTVTVATEHAMDDDGHMMDDDSMMMKDDERMMDDDSMMMKDDERMMDDDSMMMKDDASATGMLSDGTQVEIHASAPAAGEMMEIMVKFDDAEHVNHDIVVVQNGEEVLNDVGAHHHEGVGKLMTAPLSSDDPVEITLTFQGYGVNDPKTGPIGEAVTFTNVVPEFGTIAAMILAVAIVSIIAVTARSRLSLTPRI